MRRIHLREGGLGHERAASVRFLDGRRCFRFEVESPSDLRLLARLLGEPHYAAGELNSGSLQ